MSRTPVLKQVNKVSVDQPNVLEEKISAGEAKVKELQNLIKRETKSAKSIGIFNVPYFWSGENNLSIFDNNSPSWGDYKEYLYDRWVDRSANRNAVHPNVADLVYIMGLATTIIVTFIAIFNGLHRNLGVNFFVFCGITWLLYEVASGIIGIYHYLIRPNLINRRQANKKLKKLNKELKIISGELQINKNLLEQYEISQLNPMQKFTEVKTKSLEGLYEIVNNARKDVIPNISKSYAEVFGSALDKSEKLLELGKEDGRIVTEISKIYVIYISDISNVLLKSSENTLGDKSSVIEMLNNFNEYLDRKLDKFSKVNQLLMDSDINALNKAFIEEE